MIRQGIVPVQCDIVENMEFREGEGIIKELRLRKIEQELSVKNMERNDCIVKWKAQDAMEIKTRARERLVKEWMPTFELLRSD